MEPPYEVPVVKYDENGGREVVGQATVLKVGPGFTVGLDFDADACRAMRLETTLEPGEISIAKPLEYKMAVADLVLEQEQRQIYEDWLNIWIEQNSQ